MVAVLGLAVRAVLAVVVGPVFAGALFALPVVVAVSATILVGPPLALMRARIGPVGPGTAAGIFGFALLLGSGLILPITVAWLLRTREEGAARAR